MTAAARTIRTSSAWQAAGVAALCGGMMSARDVRGAGVEAMLQVFEGQSHAHSWRDDTWPEAKAAFEKIVGFFDKHLGK